MALPLARFPSLSPFPVLPLCLSAQCSHSPIPPSLAPAAKAHHFMLNYSHCFVSISNSNAHVTLDPGNQNRTLIVSFDSSVVLFFLGHCHRMWDKNTCTYIKCTTLNVWFMEFTETTACWPTMIIFVNPSRSNHTGKSNWMITISLSLFVISFRKLLSKLLSADGRLRRLQLCTHSLWLSISIKSASNTRNEWIIFISVENRFRQIGCLFSVEVEHFFFLVSDAIKR